MNEVRRRTHRELLVWQRSMELLKQVYAIARQLPADERFVLGAQLRRAAISVPANIAEGHARTSRREFAHHLSIARGSLAEIETLLEAAEMLELVRAPSLLVAFDFADQVRRMLSALLRQLQSSQQ